MQGILYEETSVFFFALVTLVLGGSTAWMTGRACAMTWRPIGVMLFYLLLLGVAVRFIHFAIFHGTLLSLHYYLVDTAILMIIGYVGFLHTRAGQMATQYYWLYEKSGPISYRSRG